MAPAPLIRLYEAALTRTDWREAERQFPGSSATWDRDGGERRGMLKTNGAVLMMMTREGDFFFDQSREAWALGFRACTFGDLPPAAKASWNAAWDRYFRDQLEYWGEAAQDTNADEDERVHARIEIGIMRHLSTQGPNVDHAAKYAANKITRWASAGERVAAHGRPYLGAVFNLWDGHAWRYDEAENSGLPTETGLTQDSKTQDEVLAAMQQAYPSAGRSWSEL